MCAFKCLLKSPAWIHVGCIWFFSIIMCFQLCPHYENILTSKGRGGRSWLTLKSHFSLFKQIPKNPGISYKKIPRFWSRDPGIPGISLGPACDLPIRLLVSTKKIGWFGKLTHSSMQNHQIFGLVSLGNNIDDDGVDNGSGNNKERSKKADIRVNTNHLTMAPS